MAMYMMGCEELSCLATLGLSALMGSFLRTASTFCRTSAEAVSRLVPK